MDLNSMTTNYFKYEKSNILSLQKYLSYLLKESAELLHSKKNKLIHGPLPPKMVSDLFREHCIPENGSSLEEVLNLSLKNIVNHSVRVGRAGFIGHMTQACPNFSILLETITAVMNQNLVKIETALSATYVEWQTLTWFHKLVYNQSNEFYNSILGNSDKALGNMCSGGTIANLTAMIVARNTLFPHINKLGIYESFKREKCKKAVILVSARGHYSIKKAASVLGLGEDSIIEIPCVPFLNTMDLDILEKTILHCKKMKFKIVAVIGIAGSTETGSVDDLDKIGMICKYHKIWFHVDAAWGGALLFSNQHANQLKGIQKADSVCLDGHKFMYLTLSHSVVIFKNARSLNKVRHNANYIIRQGSIDLGRTSIEGSRRFESFKFWFTINVFGRRGYELLVDNAIALGQKFFDLVQQHRDFEATSSYCTGILTYRFVSSFFKNTEKNTIQNKVLNKINKEIQKKQRSSGKGFVSRTTLETVQCGQKIVVLRVIFISPIINKQLLSEILDYQSNLGNSMLKLGNSMLKGELSIANKFNSL